MRHGDYIKSTILLRGLPGKRECLAPSMCCAA
nr:MAG TPA: hypothetical protein [Caudoviricetes sp.]